MSSSRRPFDSNYSRRPTTSNNNSSRSGSQSYSSSILGEFPSSSGGASGYTGGGGYGHQDRGGSCSRDDIYAALGGGGGGGSYSSSNPLGGGGYEDDYSSDLRSGGGGAGQQDNYEYERIPRDGVSARLKSEYASLSTGIGKMGSAGGAASSGGWRQRSPSPLYSSRSQESERSGGRGGLSSSSWTTRGKQDLYDDRGSDRNILERFEQPSQQYDSLPTLIQTNNSILRNPMSLGTGILGHGQNDSIMLQAAGGLMGSLGMQSLGLQTVNPFGVVPQTQPMQLVLPAFNPSPFGQQQILHQQQQQRQQQQQQTTPYGPGIGEQSQSIYGPQTQQAFSTNRFGSSNDDRRGSRNDRSSGGGGGLRRSEPSRSAGGGGGGGNRNSSGGVRTADPNRPNANDRKRVLRDPRPEDAKRARTSTGSGATRGGGRGKANGKATQVKRVTLGDEKPAAGGRNNNRRKSQGGGRKSEGGGAKGDTPKKAEGAAAKTDGETKEGGGEGGKKDKNKERDPNKPTKYDGIPPALLVCKVCQKVMNDGQSFESHLNGRAHISLLKILEERFAKRAELLMIESKCSEDEIGIEMERQRRAGKSGRADKNANNYCKMCDCYYTVNWGTHKVSLGHRILKEFLHPTCRFCKTHFMHRIEWATHLVSAQHLKTLQEIKEKGEIPLDEQESPTQEELFAINVELSREDRPINALTVRRPDGKEVLTDEMKEILKNDRGEIELPEGDIPIPETYDENVEVGEEAIVAVNGSRCRVCRIYIADNKDVEAHCKTKDHFNSYVSFLKRVVRHREHKAREKKEAEEKAKKEEEKRKEAEKKAAEKKEKLGNGTEEGKDENGMEVDGEEGKTTEETEGDVVVVLDEVEGDAEGEELEGEGVEQMEEGNEEENPEGAETAEGLEEEEEFQEEEETVVEEEVTEKEEEAPVPAAPEVNEVEITPDVAAPEGGKEEEVPKAEPEVVTLEEEKEEAKEEEAVVALSVGSGIVVEESSKAEVVIEEEELPFVIEKVESKAPEVKAPEVKAVAATPTPRGRGGRGGRGGMVPTRGTTPTPSRGANAPRPPPGMKNVPPRVDSNLRGGGGGNVRGQPTRGGRPPRGGSPRGAPTRGARGSRGAR